MAADLSAIQWIEFIVALLLLLFSIIVFVWVVKFYALPFNKFWKTRAMFVVATFVWVISLLLGRKTFWNAPHGFFSVTENGYEQLCQVTTLFTYGVSQPLFFITLLFMIRSKTNASNDFNLYNKHPNRVVMGWSMLWTLPMIIIHVIIIILNNTSLSDTTFFWRTFNTSSSSCVVPIISTMAFTCFYVIFLAFYIFYSNKFGKTLINKRLLQRLWWSQIFFALFLPFEVLLRFILIFTTKFQVAAEVLSHIFFFIDLIICLVGLLEFALFPVLDAAEFPLTNDMTDSLLDKSSSRKSRSVEHAAIVLDSVVLQANRSSSTNLMSNTSTTSSLPYTLTDKEINSSVKPAYNSSINEQQSVEEFRKQMARYSSNV